MAAPPHIVGGSAANSQGCVAASPVPVTMYWVRVAAAGAGLALLLKCVQTLGPQFVEFCLALDETTAWQLGTPTIIAVFALLLYPRAFSSTLSYTRGAADVGCKLSISGCENYTSNSLTNSSSSSQRLSSTATEGDASSRTGILRRIVRRFSMGRKLLAPNTAWGSPCAAARSGSGVDIPFSRRNSVGRASRTSLEVAAPGAARAPVEPPRPRHFIRDYFGRPSGVARARWQQSALRLPLTRPFFSRSSTASSCTEQDTSSTGASVSSRAASPEAPPYTGYLAPDCLAFDTTEACNQEVKQVISEDHLLQFGAMMGEASSELALTQRGAPGPVGHTPDSLYGCSDTPQYDQGWEKIVEEHKPGLHYWAWRRHLRKGLYMYKSRTVYERSQAPQMVSFTFDDHERRKEWDESATALHAIAPPMFLGMSYDKAQAAAFAQSSFMYARNKFPPPMAQREYIYARRVWYKTDDGGCYCVSRICPHPAPPAPGCRVSRVDDFASGFVVRTVPGIYDPEPASEVVSIYFEDSRVSSGIVNMAVRKALWPMVQKSEAGFRKFVAQYSHLALPRRPPHELNQASSNCAVVAEEEEISADSSSTPCSATELASHALHEIPAVLEVSTASFGVYYPALTRRFHFTPLLYKAYLGLWQAASSLVSGAATAAVAISKLLVCGHRLFVSGSLSAVRAAWSYGSLLQAAWRLRRQQAGPRAVSSHPICTRSVSPPQPISLLDLGAGVSSPAALRPYQRSSSSGGGAKKPVGRRLMQRLAAVAVKAVGVPLMHRVLSSKTSLSRSSSMSSTTAETPVGPERISECGAPGPWPSGVRSSAPSRAPSLSRSISTSSALDCGPANTGAREAAPPKDRVSVMQRVFIGKVPISRAFSGRSAEKQPGRPGQTASKFWGAVSRILRVQPDCSRSASPDPSQEHCEQPGGAHRRYLTRRSMM